jgi:hypothetical protein
LLLAEEVMPVGFEPSDQRWLPPDRALALLSAEPSSNLPESEKKELVIFARQEVRPFLDRASDGSALRILLDERARELAAAHRRVRRSIGEPVRGLRVAPHWPPDVLGLLVLQPEVEG